MTTRKIQGHSDVAKKMCKNLNVDTKVSDTSNNKGTGLLGGSLTSGLTGGLSGSGSSGSETFSAPEGAVLTATWTTGSFTSEVSFELVDASGTIVAGGDFGNTIDYTIPVVTVVEGDEWIYIDDVSSALLIPAGTFPPDNIQKIITK